jgi:rod shape determining protein RodA
VRALSGGLRSLVRGLDPRIAALVLALTLFGILFILSATAGREPDERGAGAGLKQFRWLILSVVLVAGILAIPYRWLVEHAYLLYGFGIFALVAVLFLGKTKNGSTRWFHLGVMDLQPSEFIKIILVVTLARYVRFRRSQRTFKGLGVPFVLTLMPMALILRQPDLGTAMLLLPILFAMIYVAGARARHLALIVVLGVAASVPVYHYGLKDYQRKRVDVYVDKILPWGEAPSQRELRREYYHANQAAIAVGSGGFFGKGLASDLRTHVPEPETDFIFTVIAERLGLFGVMILFGLQALLLLALTNLAVRTREPSGKLLVVGILALFGAQFLVNVGMTVGLAPITGLTLPFVSYGGSSLLSSMVAVGFALNVGMRPGFVLARRDFGDE